MTQVAKVHESKVPVLAGGDVAAIIPQSLDEVWRLANAIASANGMAPRGMEKPEQIMVAIMAGSELGLPPFQALQSFAVINGRPSLWGDGLMAVVRRNGVTVKEWHEGEVAHCEVTRPDTGEAISRKFSQADAIKAGLAGKQGPWTQYPERMRQMRARAWALRDGCADMLRGFQIREEVEDFQPIRDVTPKGTGLAERLKAKQIEAKEGFSHPPVDPAQDASFDPNTGEFQAEPSTARAEGSANNGPSEGEEDPIPWSVEALRYIGAAQTIGDLDGLDEQWTREGQWARLKAASPDGWDNLICAMRDRAAEIEPGT